MTSEPIKAPGFFVWCPSLGPPRYVHGVYQSAVDEAERLATMNPGMEFFVLGAFERFTRPKPVARDLVEFPIDLDDRIPF